MQTLSHSAALLKRASEREGESFFLFSRFYGKHFHHVRTLSWRIICMRKEEMVEEGDESAGESRSGFSREGTVAMPKNLNTKERNYFSVCHARLTCKYEFVCPQKTHSSKLHVC